MPNGSRLFFSPIAKVSGDDAMLQYEVTGRQYKEAGIGFIGEFVIGMREMRMYETLDGNKCWLTILHLIVCFTFDGGDGDSKRRAHWLIETLIQDCAAHGWGQYRTHLAVIDQIAATYNFNNNALMILDEQIKNVLDPKGIFGAWQEWNLAQVAPQERVEDFCWYPSEYKI